MKIASIQQICKGAKRIELFSAPSSSVQWISEGGAFYPLYNLPQLEQENVFTMFDIPEDKQNKIRFEHKFTLPQAICFEDHTNGETLLELGSISVYTRGQVLLPLKTSLGIVYINQKYLAPFKDSKNGVTLHERITPNGAVYIAAKEGFLLTGIILPLDVITKGFVDELESIYKLSAVAAENKKFCRDGVEEPEQMNLDDSIE